MKIVVLDGYTLNPGDLNWDDLRKQGDLTIYERSSITEVVERVQGAEVIFTNKVPLSAEVISKLPALRYIGVFATGYNIVDIEAARSQGIIVCNVPGYSTASVVQLTFALILEHFNRVSLHAASVANGDWAGSKDFSYTLSPLTELAGKTIGIIGFGTIGQQVADVAEAFGMQVIASSRTITDQTKRKNFRWTNPESLYSEADIITIHCPLTDQTKGMINHAALVQMKTSAFLVNTARGPIIVEQDLADALNNGTIAGAGLDVLSVERPSPANPLLSAKNTIITPHIAWATREARERLMQISVNNLQSYLNGKPVNVVNR
ncbi:MAG: D-2-hydroxyacid dehydrogenase [Chitinophagaceae bacterium]|nr:MAG: D-2-hydroxyacid dehydrogenase [Chitinophagaceae bacterium]